MQGVVASSGSVTASVPSAQDLFRFSAPGVRVLTASCSTPSSAYFSYTGANVLSYFNNTCNGADFGDWQTGVVAAQVQDAIGSTASSPTLGPNEIAALTAIGYTATNATPEPGTWILLGTCFPALAMLRRRQNRR